MWSRWFLDHIAKGSLPVAIIIEQDITGKYLQAAMERAAANRAAGRTAQRLDDGSYVVPSARTEEAYRVVIVNLTLLQASCDCPHGSREDARGYCWHKVSAMAEEVRRLGGRYTVKPHRRRTVAEVDAAVRRLYPTAA